MFDIGFSRIVWKEFRTQWHVWSALAIGAFVFQALFLLFGREFQQSVPNYPLEVALVLTACYALTGVAILYAGEREERTDELLQQLPLPPGRLFWGKVCFAALSVLTFALVVFALGFIVKVVAPYGSERISDTWGQHALGFLQGIGGMVLWGLFYSLLLSRVMAVLFAAVTTQLLVAFVASNFLPKPFEAWLLGIGVIVAAADIWLARHWLSGRSVVPVFEGTGGTGLFGRSGRSVVDAHAPIGETIPHRGRATTDRRSRFWLRSITWAAGRTPLVARESAVLLWREVRSAVPFAIAWGLLGILMVDLLMRRDDGPWNVLWICATPLVCGLWTCVGDNWRQTFRFLTDRGLNPAIVWLTKHAVWFSLAIALVLLLGLWDIAMSDRMREPYSSRSTQNLTAWARLGELSVVSLRHHGLELFRSELALRHVSMVASLGLSLYLVGHLCSLWFRRVAVAVGVALVAGILLGFWHGLAATVDIPNRYATWPLVIVLLVASLVTAGGWMHETAGWRYRLQQTAWVVVPVVGVMLASLWYRANQIPMVALDFNWQAIAADMQRSDPAWTSRWRTVFGNLETQFGSHAAVYSFFQNDWLRQDLGIATEQAAPADNGAADQGGDEPSGADFEAMGMSGTFGSGSMMMEAWEDLLEDDATLATLDQLTTLAADLESPTTDPQINPTIWELLTQHSMQRVTLIGKVLAAAAHQHGAVGNLDAAWEKLHAGLVLTDYLQRQVVQPVDLHGTWFAREAILQQIHAWAAHPDQTIERLQAAGEVLNEFHLNPSIQSMNRRRYAWERHRVESDDNGLINALSPLLRPSERERIIRLMTLITAGYEHQVQHGVRAGTDDPLLNWPWVSPEITEQHIERWRATTPLLPDSLQWHHMLDLREVITTEVATWLVLDLHAWRLEHGDFPQTLHELLTDAEGKELPRDPYAGGNFGYAPQGFDEPVLTADSTGHSQPFVVPANTPLLWSSGGTGGDIIRSKSGEYYAASIYIGSKVSTEVETQAAAEDTTRLLFVILGRWPWQ